MKKFILFAALQLIGTSLLNAQSKQKPKTPIKRQDRNYYFLSLPMMTDAISLPTKEGALKAAMKLFMEWDPNVAASLDISCNIVKVHDLTFTTMPLPKKLPDGSPDFKANIQVPLKFSHVTWDATITVKKDITLEHLWYTVDRLVDFHLLSYFQQHLEKSFYDRIYQAIYTDRLKNGYVLKAGETFKISEIHSYIAAEAKSDNWMCYMLKDDDHPGNYLKDVPTLTLNKATTLDAKTINVDYTIGETAEKEIHFEVYRSERQTKQNGDNAILICDTDVTNTDLLARGSHSADKALTIPLLPGKELAPDTRMPFVVVVATANSNKQTVYFRKWLLGAISHGFDRFALYESPVPIMTNLVWQSLFQKFDTPEWETAMAKNLRETDKYDDVIEFNWMHTCAIKQHGLAEKAGLDLALDIGGWIRNHQQHPGDVTDIHLIGHSRGTVVVTQALNELSNHDLANYSHYGKPSVPFGGSYVELTLLDPHPANNNLETPWVSWAFNFTSVCQTEFNQNLQACTQVMEKMRTMPPQEIKSMSAEQLKQYLSPCGSDFIEAYCEHDPTASSKTARDSTINFQLAAKDSKLEINSGVKKIDVFFQHTFASQLCSQPDQEFIQNLWGMVSPTTLYCLDNNIAINKTDLTNVDIDGIGYVGHNQVPLVYEQLWVDSGTLNRSPIPTVSDAIPSN